MEYDQIRKEILDYLIILQNKGFSYQNICDYINTQQTDYVWYKDFFSRFRSKYGYYKGGTKSEKLESLHTYLQVLFKQHIKEKDLIQEHLKKVIANALDMEFAAYLHINRSKDDYRNKNYLLKYYQDASPAFLSIVNNLKHKTQYAWILDQVKYGSSFKLLSIEIENMFSQNAVIHTHEFWKLFWVDQISQKVQYKYEAINEQVYLLSKNNKDQWKIVENIYKSGQKRIQPEFIDKGLLAQIAKEDDSSNLNAVHSFIGNNQLLYSIEFLKQRYHQQFEAKDLAFLETLRNNYLNTHRLFNTDVIDFDLYKKEMVALKKQILNFCEDQGIWTSPVI